MRRTPYRTIVPNVLGPRNTLNEESLPSFIHSMLASIYIFHYILVVENLLKFRKSPSSTAFLTGRYNKEHRIQSRWNNAESIRKTYYHLQSFHGFEIWASELGLKSSCLFSKFRFSIALIHTNELSISTLCFAIHSRPPLFAVFFICSFSTGKHAAVTARLCSLTRLSTLWVPVALHK